MEVWKPITSPEDIAGRYEISNLGNIKRLGRTVRFKDGRVEFLKEKLMSPHSSPTGYMNVRLTGKTTSNTYRVHRLVAEAFIDNPNSLPEVNHKDEDKTNNCADNLEWCTHQYNACYGTRLERLGAMTSARLKGRKRSLETRMKLSIARSCLNHTEEWKLEHYEELKQRFLEKHATA